MSTPNVRQTIELFNVTTGQFVAIDERAVATSDQSLTFSVDTNADDFVNSGGVVQARILLTTDGPVLGSPWSLRIDQFQFQVQ